MKRTLISAILALILCLSLAVTVFADMPGNDMLLIDQADLLTDAEEAQLNQKLESISHAHNAQIVIATIDDIGGASINFYVEQFYDTIGFGYGERKDGVLLLVCMDVREFRILSNGFAASAISGYEIDAISDVIVSDLSDGDYADAFHLFADQCDYYIDGYLNGFPFDFGGKLSVALVVGLFVGLITAFVLRGQLKSVYKQSRAHDYMKTDSMRLTAHSDIFLYRNITRTKKESSGGSGGSSRSGSSRSVGGRSF